MRIVSSRLRVAIARAGYSQSQFAAECGISRPLINKLCNDKYEFEPSDYTLQRFAQILGVTPEYLTGKEGFDPDNNLSKEEKAQRLLFDLFVTLGRIEPLADGSGLFRLHGHSNLGCGDIESFDMPEDELHNVLSFFQKKLDRMCDEYIDLCGIHNRQEFIKQWHSKEVKDLIISRNKAVDELRKYQSQK